MSRTLSPSHVKSPSADGGVTIIGFRHHWPTQHQSEHNCDYFLHSQHPTNTVKVSAFNMEKARVSHYLTKANDRYRLSFASFLWRNNSLISRTKAVTLSTFDPISTDPTQKQSATSRSLLLYQLSSEFFIKNKLANKVRIRVIYSILEMP